MTPVHGCTLCALVAGDPDMLTERQPAFSPDSPDFELSERERADAEDGAAGDHKSYTTDFDHDSYMS